MQNKGRVLTVLLAGAVLLALVGHASLIRVAPAESIQAAVDAAQPDDAVQVQSGIYHESLNVSKRIILEGMGHPLLDAGASGNAITLRADNTTISGFDIRTTRRIGIQAVSSNNIITNNSISGCLDGIRLDKSNGNSVTLNDVNNNTNGITLLGAAHNTIINNSIRDNKIGEESDCGIFLAYSEGNLIRENNLSGNGDSSISLRSSSNNRLIGNNVTRNDWYGISLAESSNLNLLETNNASSNKDTGIYLDSSRENIIRDNTALDNAKGIYLAYNSNDNLLESNNASFNQKGLHLAHHSSNNTLTDNMVRRNDYGIHLTFSAGWNLIYNNSLIDNIHNAYDMGLNNRWDNGSLGNRYSDLGRVFYIPGGSGVDGHPLAAESGI